MNMDHPENRTVNHPDDIPEDMTEAQEAEFWTHHELGEGMLEGAADDQQSRLLLGLVPTRPSTASKPTSIRLPDDLEQRLKRLARLKGMTYQTLLKQFVTERLYEEEKRHKVI